MSERGVSIPFAGTAPCDVCGVEAPFKIIRSTAGKGDPAEVTWISLPAGWWSGRYVVGDAVILLCRCPKCGPPRNN